MNTEVRFLAQHLLHAGLSPLAARDRRVIARVARRVHTARNLNREFEDHLTLSQRLACRPDGAACASQRARPGVVLQELLRLHLLRLLTSSATKAIEVAGAAP